MTKINARTGLASVLAIGVAAYLVLSIGDALRTPSTADAAHTAWASPANITYIEGDSWYNYDFDSQSASQSNVDWPLRFVMYWEAEIDFVKHRLDGCGNDPTINPQLCDSGGQKWHRHNDGGGITWDQDGGKKQELVCQWDPHMRFYANPIMDYNYNSDYRFYIFATNHEDYEHGCSPNVYSSTEAHEAAWRSRVTAVSNAGWGWVNRPDPSYQSNYEPGRWWTSTAYVQSNGYVSYVIVYD